MVLVSVLSVVVLMVDLEQLLVTVALQSVSNRISASVSSGGGCLGLLFDTSGESSVQGL